LSVTVFIDAVPGVFGGAGVDRAARVVTIAALLGVAIGPAAGLCVVGLIAIAIPITILEIGVAIDGIIVPLAVAVIVLVVADLVCTGIDVCIPIVAVTLSDAEAIAIDICGVLGIGVGVLFLVFAVWCCPAVWVITVIEAVTVVVGAIDALTSGVSFYLGLIQWCGATDHSK